MKRHFFSIQFLKFAFVGMVNTLTTFCTYALLTRASEFFRAEYVLAEGLAYGLGTIVSFLLNRRWTFRQKHNTNILELVRFYTVMMSGLLLNVGALYVFVQVFRVYDLLAVALSLILTIIWNFLLMKLWVFTGPVVAEDQRKRKVIVVFSGRFPSEKADALFAHENAVAFSKVGEDTVLVAPRRFGHGRDRGELYQLVYLPTLDLIRIPILWSIASYVNLFVFSVSLLFWLASNARGDDVLLCNEPMPLLFASLAIKNIVYEIHISPVRHGWFYRVVFACTRLAVPISEYNGRIAERFGIPRNRIVIARSAVDTTLFKQFDKRAARERLHLRQDESIAVYTGHLFDWKGVDTLAETARLTPEIRVCFVGGTEQDVARFKETYKSIKNIDVVGFVPHREVPLWQAAADILAIPNSAKKEISVHYTSPMKLFEYMASERPILASDLPSIREVLSDETGYFAEADNPASFAAALRKILADSEGAARRAIAARLYVENQTWEKRAQKILAALNASV